MQTKLPAPSCPYKRWKHFQFWEAQVVTTLNSMVRCCAPFRGIESETENIFLKTRACHELHIWGLLTKSSHFGEGISHMCEHFGYMISVLCLIKPKVPWKDRSLGELMFAMPSRLYFVSVCVWHKFIICLQQLINTRLRLIVLPTIAPISPFIQMKIFLPLLSSSVKVGGIIAGEVPSWHGRQ